MNRNKVNIELRSTRLRSDDAPQEGHFQRWFPALFRPFFTSFTSYSTQREGGVLVVTTNRCGH